MFGTCIILCDTWTYCLVSPLLTKIKPKPNSKNNVLEFLTFCSFFYFFFFFFFCSDLFVFSSFLLGLLSGKKRKISRDDCIDLQYVS
jgi:hypothetical protein